MFDIMPMLPLTVLITALLAALFALVEWLVDRRVERRRVALDESIEGPATRRELLDVELRLAAVEDRLSRWDPMVDHDVDVTAGWRERERGRRGRGQRPPRHWRRGVLRHERKKARVRR